MTIFLRLLVLIYVISLISCEDSEDSNSIDFWHFQSEPHQKAALDSLLSLFTLSTGIEVNTTELSWGDGKTKLIAGFNSQQGPDILELGSDWIAQFASESIFVEFVDSVVSEYPYLEFALDAAKVNGSVYALPWFVDSRPVMINTTLLSELGIVWNDSITWEDISKVDVSHLPDGKYLIGINGPDRHRLYKKILPMIWSQGETLYNSSRYNFNSHQTIQAIEMYANLAENGIVETQKNLDVEFLKGNIAILNSGSWLINKMKASNHSFDIVTFPPTTAGNQGYAFAGGEYLAISQQSAKIEHSLKLAQFLTTGKHALLFSQLVPEAGFPADQSVFDDSTLVQKKWKIVFAEQLRNSRMTPSDNQWLDVEELLEEAVEQVLYKKRTAAESMQELNAKINELQ